MEIASTQDTADKNGNELKKAKRQVEHQLAKQLRNTKVEMKEGNAMEKRNNLKSELQDHENCKT